MKLKRLCLTSIIIAICVMTLSLQAATAAQEASISVEPTYTEVWQGDEFTVNVTVDPEGSGVYGANYALYFNNTLLNATSQAQGPFLTQDGASSAIYQEKIDNNIGEIIYAESRTGTAVGVTDPGVLTTITFQVIGEEGISPLNLGDSDGLLLCSGFPLFQPIPTTVNNGSVEVRNGICGDVNDDGDVDMTDVMTLWYDIADYPYVDAYTISNEWAADVNCDGDIDMTDVMTLWYDIADYPYVGAYEVDCCG